MKIEPFSGLSSPMIDFRSTDLPVPEGPSRTLTSPAGRVSVTSDQMVELPNDVLRFLMPTSTPAMESSRCRRGVAECTPCVTDAIEPAPHERGVTSSTTDEREGYSTGNLGSRRVVVTRTRSGAGPDGWRRAVDPTRSADRVLPPGARTG